MRVEVWPAWSGARTGASNTNTNFGLSTTGSFGAPDRRVTWNGARVMTSSGGIFGNFTTRNVFRINSNNFRSSGNTVTRYFGLSIRFAMSAYHTTTCLTSLDFFGYWFWPPSPVTTTSMMERTLQSWWFPESVSKNGNCWIWIVIDDGRRGSRSIGHVRGHERAWNARARCAPTDSSHF